MPFPSIWTYGLMVGLMNSYFCSLMTFCSCLLQYYTGHGQSINELKFHPRNCSLLLSVSKGVLRCNLSVSVDCFIWTVTSIVAVNSSLLQMFAFSFCFKINLHNLSQICWLQRDGLSKVYVIVRVVSSEISRNFPQKYPEIYSSLSRNFQKFLEDFFTSYVLIIII